MRLATVAFVMTLAAGIAVAEDRLILKDGQVVAGRIVSESDSEVQILSNEKTVRVPRTTIDRVERAGALTASSPTAPPAPPARASRPAADHAGHGHGPTARAPHEATPEFLKWIDLCVQNLGSADPGVRQGATVALRAAGATAKPALDKAAAGDNAKLADAAKSVLNQVANQGHPGPSPRGGRSLGQPGGPAMIKQLDLSAEQQPKVEDILGQHDKSKEEIAKSARDGRIPKDQAKTKLTALKVETETKLSKVLNAEQLKKYKDLSTSPIAEAPATKARQ